MGYFYGYFQFSPWSLWYVKISLFVFHTRKENHFLSSGTAQGWVNNGRIFIYGWTNPLISLFIRDIQTAGDKWSMNECEHMRLLKARYHFWALCVCVCEVLLSLNCLILQKKSFVYSGYLHAHKKKSLHIRTPKHTQVCLFKCAK